jgi:hypothetical protein
MNACGNENTQFKRDYGNVRNAYRILVGMPEGKRLL